MPSISAVSTLPSAPTASPSGTGEAIAGLDFAALLLGQFAPTSGTGLAEQIVELDGASASSDPSGDDVDTSDNAGIAAELLATLGLLTQRPPATAPVNAEAPAANGEDSAASLAPLAGSTLKALPETSQTLEASQTLETPDTTPQPQLRPETSAVTLPESAKFAVTENVVTTTETDTGMASPTHAIAGHTVHAPQPQHQEPTPLTVSTPVYAEEWSGDFGQKIVWMTKNDQQTAQMTLNPPQMGPIEISLSVDNNNATASFVSASADVREAIENALPRLREMLAGAGIELGQANVSAESFRQQQNNSNGAAAPSTWRDDNAILAAAHEGETSPAKRMQLGNGLVDLFA
ncbi:flagellar hook-length control protein FliK [Propionivibrio limicola]|uniref:flagellar hook-length control protein FliK n=1 Tax=Propionivibrio limicola TaxID=167645 RepID=UPI0012923DA4|nr:flagellar hook-length control protein FliK [Propionivibrio limicola]